MEYWGDQGPLFQIRSEPGMIQNIYSFSLGPDDPLTVQLPYGTSHRRSRHSE